jgi:phage tail-like protein
VADTRDQPFVGSSFLVCIGEQDGREPSAGFAEVIFPPFERDHERGTPADAEGPVLVLRRGLTGRLDLYEWWAAARRTQPPPTRAVTIQLLAPDRRTVVVTWRFLQAYPVTLSYSPLSAVSNAVVMEQVELAFERVEMG